MDFACGQRVCCRFAANCVLCLFFYCTWWLFITFIVRRCCGCHNSTIPGIVSMCINSHNVRVPLSKRKKRRKSVFVCSSLLTNMFRNRNLRSEAKLSEENASRARENSHWKNAVRAFLHFRLFITLRTFFLSLLFSFESDTVLVLFSVEEKTCFQIDGRSFFFASLKLKVTQNLLNV